MKTPLWLATEHARAFVRNRGWRVEPLTWEEVELIVDAAGESISTNYQVGFDAGYDAGRKALAGMLEAFHERFGQHRGHGDIADSTLRIRLHREETQELIDELEAGNLIGVAHELADVVYVAYGTAHSLGIPLDAVIDAVHRANMSKFGPDGKPVVDEGGKFLKGPHYRPPDVAAVLARKRAAS